MPLIPAVCTQCGAVIKVDSAKEADVCEHCGMAFITEKAVNNYTQTINVDSAILNIAPNIDNLILRAKRFEVEGELGKARLYYERILDVDISNAEANAGVERLSRPRIGGHELTWEQVEQIDAALRGENKILAISIYKDITGDDLKHSRKVIEEYMRKRGFASAAQPTSSGGRYVATCVYGSYDCPEVWTLRRFRDSTLAATWCGRAFIRAYYAVSPALVRRFGDAGWFKGMWHGLLDAMVSKLQSSGVASTPYSDKAWK